ncbi:hypothetical protein V9L05_21200 [Bernardetia sp. Wsw4-3y2]|uniref:hypothetical protein n=1 Tax=Bernardetia sp. Wsw4-3y2 TaxID=3127471 RepID=UPI0030D38EBD
MKLSKIELINFLNSKNPSSKSTEKNIDQVLYFTLIWNSFEGSFFFDNVELNNQTLFFLAQNSTSYIQERYVDELFDFFRNRYVSNNKIRPVFKRLRFCYKKNRPSNQKVEKLVQDTLLANAPSFEAKMKVLLLIIYRFRNNLFHGVKSPLNLNKFENIYGHINTFLIRYVTALIDYKANIRKNLFDNYKNIVVI